MHEHYIRTYLLIQRIKSSLITALEIERPVVLLRHISLRVDRKRLGGEVGILTR